MRRTTKDIGAIQFWEVTNLVDPRKLNSLLSDKIESQNDIVLVVIKRSETETLDVSEPGVKRTLAKYKEVMKAFESIY